MNMPTMKVVPIESVATPCKEPCPQCVFRRDSKPGFRNPEVLGGSPVEVYIGQSVGPYAVPCHMHYKDRPMPQVREQVLQIPQCAGMAVYRANLKLDVLMPDGISKLPADHATVFSSHAEFMAHHLGISQFEATKRLLVRTPMMLLQEQLSRPTNKVMGIATKGTEHGVAQAS